MWFLPVVSVLLMALIFSLSFFGKWYLLFQTQLWAQKKTGMAAAFDDERTNRQANFFKEKRNSQELFGENYIHMLKSKVFEELLGMI